MIFFHGQYLMCSIWVLDVFWQLMAAITRRMVGETYADALGVPKGSGTWAHWLKVELRMAMFRTLSILGELPLIGSKLSDFMFRAVKRAVLGMLGGQRTMFLLKQEPSDLNRKLLDERIGKRQQSLRSKRD
jgi:hypothetical protein